MIFKKAQIYENSSQAHLFVWFNQNFFYFITINLLNDLQ